MAKQELLWTALPNGMTAEGELKVSVMVSPRLDPDGAPHRLDVFADWLDWPDTLSRATFEVRYGSDVVKIPPGGAAVNGRLSDTLGLPDSAAWGALFAPDLLVRPSPFEDLTGHEVISYDAAALDDTVRGLYGDLAANATDDMPVASDFLEHPSWKTLIDDVALLDAGSVDPKTGLRDPASVLDRRREQGRSRQQKVLAAFMAYHTPPAKPDVVTHVRDDDTAIEARWLQYKRTPLPDPATIAKELDFHQIVAAMNQYPTLLRRLGIVVDLIVPAGAFHRAVDDALSVTVSFAPALVTPSSSRSPLTHTELSRNQFCAVPSVTPAPDALRVSEGLLDIDPNRFRLLQSDVDAAGSKLMGFARSLHRLGRGDRRVDPVTRKERETGAPSLRTAGLMLVHRARGAALEGRFAENQKKDQAPVPELYAEDLVRGFRFDIWDGTTRAWRSLFQRLATYELDGGSVIINMSEDRSEEGTSRLAATIAPDPTHHAGKLWLHEALVTWHGWSLAAPQPGSVIGRVMPPDAPPQIRPSAAEVPPGLRLRTEFFVLPGSLPRLRFRRRYWIRGRVVDLAGNSLPPQETDFGPEHPADHAQPFLRYEPIAAPVLALREDDQGKIWRPLEGESMALVAIRTFNGPPPDNTVPTQQGTYRIAVPVQSSVREAEQHGCLDAGGRVDKTKFAMLAMEKDKDAGQPGAVPREERLPMQGALDSQRVDTVYSVCPDGQALTYLPEPLAFEVAARFFRHPNIEDTQIIRVPFYPEGDWPDARPFAIHVFADDAASPVYDAATHTLEVPLPKAVRARLRLSIMPSGDALETMGVWHWLSGAQQAALGEMAHNGQHWMLTPWRNVDLVHAVQRPLIAPEIVKHDIERELRATEAVPRLVVRCSLESTDRLDLIGEWHEPVDDPAAAGAEKLALDRARGDLAFTVKVTTPEDYAAKLDGAVRGGYPDHSIQGKHAIGVGVPARHDLLKSKSHEFYDTRYRRIRYRLEATSRFREFLPTEYLVAPPEPGGPVTPKTVDDHIKVKGPDLVTWIPNSAPPPAPRVLYVVPTFGWVRTRDEAGQDRRWRRGGGLRVYLDRPWMETGYGEMLAVVLPPSDFKGDPETEPPGTPYKKYVTQWANDPIWKSPFVEGVAPKRGDFPRARTSPDPSGSWLPEDAPSDEADQPPGRFMVTLLNPPGLHGGEAAVEVAPHDVRYDRDRRLWYCDIEIDQGASYFPFIRLALARYQPVSVSGAHLSSVVLADFMPLAPDRWLNVLQTEEPRTRRLSVQGRGYASSSGYDEASKAAPMSLKHPFPLEPETLTPADVAARSVVEVWVERLDPDRGEDFGWERVPEAVVKPDSGEAPLDPLLRFVPVDQQRRAIELQKDRQFDVLLRENLIGMDFYVLPLWSGEVTLPEEPGGDTRYRLVVAEYEEYLIDDARPDHPVPESKSRRLVFVEHVALR